MKYVIALLTLFSASAFGQELSNTPLNQSTLTSAPYNVYIQNERMGSGVQTQNTNGYTKAYYWGDGLYSVPRYLPGIGTAHMGWSRNISVKCVQQGSNVVCDGYTIQSQQEQNRGEWILFHPVIETTPKTEVINRYYQTTVIREQPIQPLPMLHKKIRQ